MRCPNTTILTVCFVLLTLSAQMTLALSLRLSKILQQNDQTREAQELKEPQQNWLDTRSEGDPVLQKRTCNTFPCMYSHLGTKAGRASLYRTLAGFIDDCLNDASCDPGAGFSVWISKERIDTWFIQDYRDAWKIRNFQELSQKTQNQLLLKYQNCNDV